MPPLYLEEQSMPFYNFKKKVKFYVVVGGLKYLVDIYPDVSFSQTFKEGSRKVKTLHTQTNMFDEAIITEASPANFAFTMPLFTTLENKPILALLLDYNTNSSDVTLKTADIYASFKNTFTNRLFWSFDVKEQIMEDLDPARKLSGYLYLQDLLNFVN